MVVLGTAGGPLRIGRNLDLMDDLHVLANADFKNLGCEIVPGGGVYPDLDMRNKDLDPRLGLFGCNQNNTIERLIPNDKSFIRLATILNIVSEHVEKSDQMALLFIVSCQNTSVGEKVSVGTDATYQAINILPKTIKVVTFDGKELPEFDVHLVIQESLNKRKGQYDFLKKREIKDDYAYIRANNVVPAKRLNSVQKALDNKKQQWNLSTRIDPAPRGGSRSCRPGAPFWTIVVVTVLAAFAPRTK
jgi:hypothetical protein